MNTIFIVFLTLPLLSSCIPRPRVEQLRELKSRLRSRCFIFIHAEVCISLISIGPSGAMKVHRLVDDANLSLKFAKALSHDLVVLR
jgi:predicted transcriptional regulator